MAAPEVSVVLPCYRAAGLAWRSAERLVDFLPRHFAAWELLVVDDGGGDFGAPPAALAGPLAGGAVRLLALPRNRGKGAAVRAGMLAARGEVRLFTDVDLPFGVEVMPLAAAYVRERGFHLAVGDRTLPQSAYDLNVGWRRRAASAAFSSFVGTFLTGYFDTQCGFKAFRGDVAEELFRLGRIERYAFDVELLYVALLHRLDVKRVPVELQSNETSAVRLVRDSLRMLADVARIRVHAHRGRYRSAALAELAARDLERMRGRVLAAPAPRREAARP